MCGVRNLTKIHKSEYTGYTYSAADNDFLSVTQASLPPPCPDFSLSISVGKGLVFSGRDLQVPLLIKHVSSKLFYRTTREMSLIMMYCAG